MSTDGSASPSAPSTSALPTRILVTGSVLFTVTLAAWLFGSLNHIDTTVLWSVAPTLLGALFLASPIGRAANNAQQAALQTNGMLDARIRSGVSAALAEHVIVTGSNPIPSGAQPAQQAQPVYMAQPPPETGNTPQVRPS